MVLHTAVDDDAWVKTCYTLSMYLYKDSNLITDMGKMCPKKTNRWVTFGSVLKFYITRTPHIIEFLDECFEQASNVALPILTPSWWMVTYVFTLVIAIFNETIVKLQACDLVIYQQHELLVLFANDIRDMFKVR
jgi:hypothetical protein